MSIIYLRKIILILDIVAGEAQERSCDSNRKFTLEPNGILSPEVIVNNLLSSNTLFSDSIYSGSMSPSQMIQDWTKIGSLTTWLALQVSTPSVHSLVSISM